jgi:hypothetical protein
LTTCARNTPHGRVRWGLGASAFRVAAVLTCIALPACPLPQNDPRGLELAWMFLEGNDVDGNEGKALRTCDGALANEVDVRITDRRDPSRTRGFSWACEDSWASPDLFFVAPPPVFIDLREGTYVVDTVARDEHDEFTRELATIAVDSTTTTSLLVALALPSVTLEVQLDGLAACDDVALRLRYADPDEDVLGAPLREPSDAYRDALVSDEGLTLDGTPIPCDSLPDRLVVRDVDRGAYVLEYVVDGGASCLVPVELRGESRRVTLDLGEGCPS